MSDTSARSQYRSDLATTPLPEVLLTVHKYRAPGVIECSRDEVRKSVYLDQGNIIFASSNRTPDSLGDRLLAAGKITREQYDESVRRLTQAGNTKRQGTILVEMAVLQPKDLFVNVRDQVQEIVWSIFDWTAGEVTFTPGRDKQTEFIKLAIPIREAVMEGIRKITEPKRLIARVGSKGTILERVPDGDESDLKLDAQESAFLGTVDGKKTLFELVSAGPLSPAQGARLLYAFRLLGLVRPRATKPMKVQFRTMGEKF
ncbi:MAG TPA: DUF4388 domain-containing protein [Thermoanaerobaculia bacterium]